MNVKEFINLHQMHTIYTPPCPCCCSAYMIEIETGWVCPVCGAVVDK